jgi:aminomethyltransferase
MKSTIFNEFHHELGARLIEFAGFNMPVEYSGINNEHNAVRQNVGIFDISHMGDIWVKGQNALSFLQKVTTNDVSKLVPGKCQYTCFPNGKGGIVDDLIIYCYSTEKYFLVVNASNIEKDYQHLLKHKIDGVEIENASERMSQVAVQGPKAQQVLQKLTTIDLAKIQSFTFVTCTVAGIDDVILSATGYTGSGGFELYFHNNTGKPLWNAILNAGREEGILPIGLAARDTLRLEMGYSLYGNDIDDTTSPIEAGLGWVTKFVDGKDFIDKGILWEQKNKGTHRQLVAFELIDKGIPRHEYVLFNDSGDPIGHVTSGTMSPSLKKAIGMGYVESQYSKPGSEIFIEVRGKRLKAVVVSLPFYKVGK